MKLEGQLQEIIYQNDSNSYTIAVLKTEEDEVIEVARPKSAAHDMLFIQTMKDILKSGIWIPVNKKLKQLLRYDWFETPVEQYSF